MFYKNPFKSFWMGGFECADHLNSSGNRVDLLTDTDHLDKLAEDYQLLKTLGINTVREGIRWSFVEKTPYQYDFGTVEIMLKKGRQSGIQQIWDICHFGFPDDLSPLHPHFTDRFVAICSAFAKFHRLNFSDLDLIITPINEVSFLSWLGGEAGATAPYCKNNGWEVKYALMRAYIQGIKALKAIDPNIRILTTEPLVNIVPELNASVEEEEIARATNNDQFQSLDILAGYICPELGGGPELLDILGFNYYYNNQWIVGFQDFLPWANELNDPRWRPLSQLLKTAWLRYNKPIVLTETSHPGEDRHLWMEFIAQQCVAVIEDEIPFWGVCLYPIIDRPDWDNLDHWHHSGMWDQQLGDGNFSLRILHEPYRDAFIAGQKLVQNSIQQKKIGQYFSKYSI